MFLSTYATLRRFRIYVPNTTPIRYTWRSGRLFGVPVDLHWSFLLIPFAIAWFSWVPGTGFNYRALTWYGSVSVLLFAFILIHELGHALAAKNRGVVAERIVLFPLGGGAYLPDQPKQLWAEVFVYAAGPLANLLLTAVALPILLLQPDGTLLLKAYLNPSVNAVLSPTLWQQLLAMTVVVNLLLALGNLLPAYPLDGGRILRALLRRPLGKRPATQVATVLGIIIGIALIYVGYLIGDWLLLIGAVFIIVMSATEYQNGWQRRQLASLGTGTVLRSSGNEKPYRLYPGSRVAEARELFSITNWPVLPVYDNWNSLLGFVEATHLEEDAEDDTLALAPFFEAEFVSAAPQENLLSVTERIVDANVYGAAVYGDRGALVGYVFTYDVLKLLRPWWRFWK